MDRRRYGGETVSDNTCPHCGARSLVQLEPGTIRCLLCASQVKQSAMYVEWSLAKAFAKWEQITCKNKTRKGTCEVCGENTKMLWQCVNPDTGERQQVCSQCESKWARGRMAS